MTLDTKSGALVIHLDYPSCFNCEVGIRDAGYDQSVIAQRAVGQKDEELGRFLSQILAVFFNNTIVVNVGERVIAGLFKYWCSHFTAAKSPPSPLTDPSLEASLTPIDASVTSSSTSSLPSPSQTSVDSVTSSSTSHYRPPSHLFDVGQSRSKHGSKWWKYDQGVENLPAARGGTDVSVASLLTGNFAEERYSYYYKNSSVRRHEAEHSKSSSKGKDNDVTKRLLPREHLVEYVMDSDVIVSVEELDPKTQFARVLYRSLYPSILSLIFLTPFSSRKAVKDFDGTELVPQFVFDALVERFAPCETPYRLPIVLTTEDDFFPTKGSKKKFAFSFPRFVLPT